MDHRRDFGSQMTTNHADSRLTRSRFVGYEKTVRSRATPNLSQLTHPSLNLLRPFLLLVGAATAKLNNDHMSRISGHIRFGLSTKETVVEELIQLLTTKLGIDASVASGATGKAMAMLKEQAGDDLFGKIADAVPGLGEAAEQSGADDDGGGGGGMLGKLAGMASGAIGGSAGQGLELGAALKNAGLETEQMGGFASTVIEFLKDKVGDEVIDQLLEKVPMLKSLVG